MRDMLTSVMAKKAKEPESVSDRKKSKLVRIGEEAMRRALLEALVASEWNLTHTAEALEMTSASSVLRSIRQLGLLDKYKNERKRRVSEMD